MTALAAVMTAEQTGWCGFFTSFENSHEGFVDSKEQLDELVWRFAAETKSCFTSVKTSTNFGNTDITKKQHKVQWCDKQELPDHPYIVVHTERFECHHGPDRNKSKKEKAKTNQEGDHHTYQKRRYHTQKTKKLGCPAAIVAKEIIFFTEYKGSVSKYKREQISKEIRKKIGEGDLPQFQRQILVKLPTKHENHLPGEVAEISLPVDKRVTSKVEEYVSEGFTSSSCIRSLIELFVRNELFIGQKCPSWIDRRFFPTQRDISNAIYSAKMKAMKSKYDQENLQAHIDDWAKERPEDSFSFSATEVNSENVEETSGGFFFLYQSSWQKRLLNLYGNELCLLDATYRTTKYAIPLFFLCVKTNVDYSVVAVFACQSENSHTIAKALRLIKEWNPNWNPKHFMTDLCEAELNAIATCFPDCHSFICDFHREQAWGRWLKASKHGLNKNKDDILPLLRRIARASSQTDFDQAISNLMENRFWEQQKDFRDWFTNTWLKNVQKWAWVYRQDRLLVNINTNNGVERQNRTLKYDFLSKYTDRTLTGMLTTVIKRFLPDQYRKYLDVNIKASAYYKRYNENLPLFLHNRPKEFIDHCRKRLSSAEEVEGKIEVGDGMFTVQSFTDPYSTYVVTLGTETDVPSCQCHDWLHSHWPCKHMLAVVMHYPGNSWDDLAAHYRNNVMFVLDHLCVEDIGFKVSSGNQLIPDSDESIDYVDGESTVVTPGTEDISIKTEEVESKDLLAVIREELEHIKALTYLEVPVSVQTKVLEELTMVRVILNEAVPSEHQLPLLHSKETVKSSGKAPFNIIKRKSKPALRKASTVRRKFKELPSRRKRKVAVKRDQCNPMKKMKLSSPVTESSPGNEQGTIYYHSMRPITSP
ncbi:hypothetical protein FSP39_014287 [Pinctada imbricata]|uniref:SWIM-type domain-containing protein n=1 Tax=Pinctada imbricata TaxID=66713 RepID=A0AA88XD76_PINIB|nr:hypothetical protein FSP39_014287 [Pinctada imbricata]